ncbi:MAG: energy-coupling factor transporter ATPase [Clostridia bacterium]|nr:energy-coupling factor transporter ATPase [Clostridia bacterium]
MSSIRFDNVSYIYAKGTPFEKEALDGVSIELDEGMTIGIIGHTGSGKSTMAQVMNGLIKPDSGDVYIHGENIWADPKNIKKYRFIAGLVFQYPEYQLFEETVYKDIAFGPKNMGLDDAEIDARIKWAAGTVGITADLLNKSPFDLSGGQKRRVAIAGIVAMRPSIMILDEPAAGLDPRGRDEILSNIIRYQRESSSTVIMISHSMEDMARYCDKILVMNHGKVFRYGTPAEIFSDSDSLENIGLAVPQITRVMRRLKQLGNDVNTAVYTVDEAHREILRLIGGDGK